MTQTLPSYQPSDSHPDFHAVVSVTLGELIQGKWVDWSQESWHWDAYDEAQYQRVCKKFNDHYWDREIGVLPPGSWKRELLRKFNEIMPKYKPLYAALDAGQDILQVSGTYGKKRNIFSDFPATQIAPSNQDYATNANDEQYETITDGDWFDKIKQIKTYNDIDLLIINDLDTMFSCLLSVNFNAIF